MCRNQQKGEYNTRARNKDMHGNLSTVHHHLTNFIYGNLSGYHADFFQVLKKQFIYAGYTVTDILMDSLVSVIVVLSK